VADATHSYYLATEFSRGGLIKRYRHRYRDIYKNKTYTDTTLYYKNQKYRKNWSCDFFDFSQFTDL